ncbi:MAG: hypothetical protein ACFFAH_10740 [Promethearchaeota archaeon]
MRYNTIIVKIGGKILEDPEDLGSTISQLKHLLDKNSVQKIIIITGGGSYANFIRVIDQKLNIGNDLAHWMAVYAMNHNGKLLSEKYSFIKLFDDFTELQLSTELFSIFLPFNYLYKFDELPHSWDVTSDSIILYFTHKLELNKCFLIKDIDGIINNDNQVIREITVDSYKNLKETNKLLDVQKAGESIKKSQPVDSYSIELIEKYKISCIILNGKAEKHTILDYFNKSENKTTIYTRIKFN